MIALMMGSATGARAQDIEANGIFYNIISDTQVAVAPAFIDGVNHYEGCIILPERVYCDGVNYEVAAIAPRAFWQSRVTQIQIPNSVTMIGEAAFADAEDLTDITLPLGLTAVSRYMLAGTAVANVVLPEGVTDIEKGAFEDCSQLRTVYLPMTLRTIDDNAFGYCVSLKEVYCDASVKNRTTNEEIQGLFQTELSFVVKHGCDLARLFGVHHIDSVIVIFQNTLHLCFYLSKCGEFLIDESLSVPQFIAEFKALVGI